MQYGVNVEIKLQNAFHEINTSKPENPSATWYHTEQRGLAHGGFREDHHTGLRRPVQPADRAAHPRGGRLLRDPELRRAHRHLAGRRAQGRDPHRRAEQRLRRKRAAAGQRGVRAGRAGAGHLLRHAADQLRLRRRGGLRGGGRVRPHPADHRGRGRCSRASAARPRCS